MMTVAGGISTSMRMRTRPWTTTQSTDWWERVMTEFQPSDWLDKFRMSRETFFHLCDTLRPRLTRQNTSLRLALPVEKRVAAALWRLASNVEYRTISELFGVGKSTVCCCVRDLCHAIALLLKPAYLRCPGDTELRDSADAFRSRTGFPHCAGAVATLHTAIITPSANAAEYANPDGWMSVMTQVEGGRGGGGGRGKRGKGRGGKGKRRGDKEIERITHTHTHTLTFTDVHTVHSTCTHIISLHNFLHNF